MKRLIATSWDDGLESDRKLLGILAHHAVRSSFALTPGRHREYPVPNDPRDVEKYGRLMPQRDLQLYAEHDVCNHTLNHHEMGFDDSLWRSEIREGKSRLEDLYGREIPGMIWPYGVSSFVCRVYARRIGHEFGRTTPAAHRAWSVGNYCRWDIVPLHWRTPVAELLSSPHSHLALYGHTYELQTADDWRYLNEFYQILSGDSDCQLVTLTQLAKDISNHEPETRL